jgi:MSHA biogenesis protein MshM
MYRDYFKLREYPFSLTPDTDFWFDAAAHRDAMNVLCATLRGGEGFIKVTAEIGLGKTLLCRQLLKELYGQFVTAYIPDPQLSAYGLTSALADEIRVGTPHKYASDDLMKFIRSRLLRLASHRTRVVLIIDEAHQLPDVTLEALRLLTNLETEKFKLLQVVIVGQPELDRRLAQQSLRQLKQRISFSCTLSPMSVDATGGYIFHRIRVAGCGSGLRFDESAVRKICKASQGIPRLINVLCHKALMVAYGRGEQTITKAHVGLAIADTETVLQTSSWRNPIEMMRAMSFAGPRNGADVNVLHGVRQ